MSLSFSCADGEARVVRGVLVQLACAALTVRQQRLLVFLAGSSRGGNATRCVAEFSRVLGCAPSTAWGALRCLRRLGLVECGVREARGCAVQLTLTGKVVVGGMGDAE